MDYSFVYIMTNRRNTVLYAVRVAAHRAGTACRFSTKYKTTKLVYYEVFGDLMLAIAREKAIKGSSRARKITLIESVNPTWHDLADEIL